MARAERTPRKRGKDIGVLCKTSDGRVGSKRQCRDVKGDMGSVIISGWIYGWV